MSFYQSVNAEWLDSNTIPDDKSSLSAALVVREQVANTQRELLNDTDDVFIKQFWKQLQSDDNAMPTVRGVVDEIGDVAYDDVPTLADKLLHKGIATWFRYGVAPDAKNPSVNVLYVDGAGIGLPGKEYYPVTDGYNDDLYKKYVEYLKSLFELYGYEWDDRIVAYEEGLADKLLTKVQYRDVDLVYNGFDPASFRLNYPFAKYEKVIVDVPAFFQYLDAGDDIIVVRKWMIACILRATAQWASPETFQLWFGFNETAMTGANTPEPKWRRGLNWLNNNLGMRIARDYAVKCFGDAQREFLTKMVVEIHAAMGQLIADAEWLTSKEEATRKLNNMRMKLGYPDQWPERPDVVIGANIVETMFNVIDANLAHKTAKIGQPVNRNEWPEHCSPQTVNASYDPINNEIIVPCGILQEPFFAQECTVECFGAIGVIIGHEITHGFDSIGRMFDAEGALRVWWTEEETAAFRARAAKVVEIYGQQSMMVDDDKLYVNGRLTAAENIADLGGLKAAFMAAKKFYGDKFDVDHKKAFFNSFAKIFRTLMRPAEIKRRLIGDPHSPPQARVDVATSHNAEWAAAFDKTPENDISVW